MALHREVICKLNVSKQLLTAQPTQPATPRTDLLQPNSSTFRQFVVRRPRGWERMPVAMAPKIDQS